MLDLPGFVLASVIDLCPEDARILRLDKCRCRIQSRSAAALAPHGKFWPTLELMLDIPLVTAIQSALYHNDQATLAQQAQTLRDRFAEQLHLEQPDG